MGFGFQKVWLTSNVFLVSDALWAQGKTLIIHLLFLPIRLFLFWFFLFHLGYCMVVFICSCGIRMKRKETKADGRENERSKTFPALWIFKNMCCFLFLSTLELCHSPDFESENENVPYLGWMAVLDLASIGRAFLLWGQRDTLVDETSIPFHNNNHHIWSTIYKSSSL